MTQRVVRWLIIHTIAFSIFVLVFTLRYPVAAAAALSEPITAQQATEIQDASGLRTLADTLGTSIPVAALLVIVAILWRSHMDDVKAYRELQQQQIVWLQARMAGLPSPSGQVVASGR